MQPLTEREREVLGYLDALLPTEEIAARMFVSVNTVKTPRAGASCGSCPRTDGTRPCDGPGSSVSSECRPREIANEWTSTGVCTTAHFIRPG